MSQPPAEATKSDAAEALGGAQRFKRLLRPVMWIITAGFVVWTAIDLGRRWNGQRVSVDWPLLAASLVPVLLSSILQGVAWVRLVERMSHRAVPLLPALRLYFDSQLARYTPGKIGLPLVRMDGAPSLGLARRTVGLSVLIEMLAWTATGSLLGFCLLFVAGAPPEGVGALAGRLALPLLALSLVGALALIAVDRRFLPAKLRQRLGFDGTGPIAPWQLPALQLVYWAAWAAHGYLLALSLGANSRGAAVTMGFSPLANVLGFVALAAPAGMGVREAVLLAGLGPIIGGPGAVSAAILSRLISLVADLGSSAVARRLMRRA